MLRTRILILILLFAGNATAQNGFTITAKFTVFPDGTKFYLEDGGAQMIIDSAAYNGGGVMHFKGSLHETPGLLSLNTLINKKYYWCNLFIGNENVHIEQLYPAGKASLRIPLYGTARAIGSVAYCSNGFQSVAYFPQISYLSYRSLYCC